jgi:Tol biopolymer transport system component
MSRRLALVALTIVASMVAMTEAAGAVLSGTNGRIAFTSGREGADDSKAQIYIRTMIGTAGGGSVVGQPVGLPNVQNRHASWSPDRTKLVFAAGTPGTPQTEEYDLYIRDLVNDTVTPLDSSQVGDGLSSDHPAWSPDGTRIAYETQPVDNSTERDIRVKTVGSDAPPLSLTTGAPIEFKPAWSPDSQTIYYAKQSAVPPASNLDIVKRPATGGSETNVAAASGVDEYQPSISPDGSKICFTLQTTPGSPGSADIYTASLPSLTGLTNLSDDNTKGDINCTWSPDGTLIAYVNGVFSQGRLVMERSDDSSPFPIQLEDDQGSNNFDGNPDWAPDGRPQCLDKTVTTSVDEPVSIPIDCADTGPAYEQTAVRAFAEQPANGSVPVDVIDLPGSITYTPNPGFVGTDAFTVKSFDMVAFGDRNGTITVRVKPINDFRFGKVKRNKKKGTAKLTVKVPGPGKLQLAKSKKVKGATKRPKKKGKVTLKIKPTGKTKEKLAEKGKAKVTAKVTFTPTGGDPKTKRKTVKLKLK